MVDPSGNVVLIGAAGAAVDVVLARPEGVDSVLDRETASSSGRRWRSDPAVAPELRPDRVHPDGDVRLSDA